MIFTMIAYGEAARLNLDLDIVQTFFGMHVNICNYA